MRPAATCGSTAQWAKNAGALIGSHELDDRLRQFDGGRPARIAPFGAEEPREFLVRFGDLGEGDEALPFDVACADRVGSGKRMLGRADEDQEGPRTAAARRSPCYWSRPR